MTIDFKKIEKNVKVNDDHILLGLPLEMTKYGKKIIIRQVNFIKEWPKFRNYFALFINYFNAVCGVLELPKDKSEYEKFRKNFAVALSKVDQNTNREIMYYLLKMFNFFGLKKRFVKKYFTIDDYAELFVYIYLYNIKGVKKNLIGALKILSAA